MPNLKDRIQVSLQLGDVLYFFNRLLACWTHQKVKRDPDSAPFTLEDLSDALSMEDMIAG